MFSSMLYALYKKHNPEISYYAYRSEKNVLKLLKTQELYHCWIEKPLQKNWNKDHLKTTKIISRDNCDYNIKQIHIEQWKYDLYI